MLLPVPQGSLEQCQQFQDCFLLSRFSGAGFVPNFDNFPAPSNNYSVSRNRVAFFLCPYHILGSFTFIEQSMRCIQCGSHKDKVVDSRMSKDGTTIRRRRECLDCNYRYTTYEQIERTELQVVKKDGSREAINREKLFRGLVKACEKRPVSMDRLDRAVEEILSDLHKDHISEVPSRLIGTEVMDKLHQIDPVAYVRYVSVYRQFDNVGEFISEIQSLENRAVRDHMQRRLFKE